MKVHEYQAKALMARYNVPVPHGKVAATPQEAHAIAQELGGKSVVKAQVHAGGRGKAGGIKLVATPQEAAQAAGALLGTRLVTHQTGPDGVPVRRLLIEEAAPVAQELYLAVLVDPAARGPVVIASEAGGMEIEEVAAHSPAKVHRVVPDPVLGLMPFQGRSLAYAMGLKAELVRPFSELAINLYRLFVEQDCTLAEVNPLVVTGDGRLLALDGKLNLDDDALFRHKDLEQLRDVEQEDPLEAQAADADVRYVRLDGDVGCLVNGAGLAMATMDMVSRVGAKPANFLDVGGSADDAKVARAFTIILGDPNVKRVLVNVFGGILRCDVVARGIVAACQQVGKNPPMVVRMLGTNVDEGRQVLRGSGLNVTLVDTLAEAAERLRR
ncbi:MAG: ADP-forming succinate--CoA ligase subunit beta [Chloroflexi bacterium]|nr:ADP-forming succinate--CoA ligase subunit beta [Chloroflexota bacterium]